MYIVAFLDYLAGIFNADYLLFFYIKQEIYDVLQLF